VEVGNTPAPSFPLGLPPPPIGISSELALMDASASSEYEDISNSFSPHAPVARASFLKDKAASLLRGATVQAFLLGPNSNRTTQQEEGLDDDGIVRGVGTLKVAPGSVDLFPSFNSGFQLVGSKGYDKATKDVSGRIPVDNVSLTVSGEETEDRIKHPVDKDADSQRMKKWINRVILVSSDDTCGLDW